MSKHYTKDVRQLSYLVHALLMDYAEYISTKTGVPAGEITDRIQNAANLDEEIGEPDALLIDEHLASQKDDRGNSSSPISQH